MKPSVVVIVGQTASGKSSLAMELASIYDGEIICADSRTVYEGLDIGTAKPTKSDQLKVKHHCLDVAGVQDKFTVSDFKELANRAIDEIRSNSKLPIIVGGSGLYVDSLVYDYDLDPSYDPKLRQDLDQRTAEELQSIITNRGLTMPENFLNKRYLIRTIEKGDRLASKHEIPEEYLMIGLNIEKNILEDRIRKRLDIMLQDGLLSEVEWAHANYHQDSEPLKGNIYRCLLPYLNNQKSLEDCLEDFVRSDLRLAKKQITWFKRNERIEWFDNPTNAMSYIMSKLEA